MLLEFPVAGSSMMMLTAHKHQTIINYFIVWCFVFHIFCFDIFLVPPVFSSENNILPQERGQISLSRLFFPGQGRSSSLFRYEPFTFDFSHPKSPQRIRTWIRGFGNWSHLSHSDGFTDLESYSYGVAVGVDRQIGRQFLFGILLGTNQSSSQGANGSFQWDSDLFAVHTSGYCRMVLQNFFVDIEGGLGYNEQSFPEHTALQWNFNGEAGTWWTHGLGKVEPYLGLRHVSLELDPNNDSKTTFLFGLRYSWKTTGIYSITSPRLYGGILHELGDRNLLNVASFTDAPTVFLAPGYKITETRFFFGGGFTSSMGSSLDIYLRYTAEAASNYSAHTLLLGMNWNY
ncbi:MAG: autotransporter outer membrane beta-barrel domain-containing protein [Planctomycetaceae bacterium]|jgi:outer membrane autotransporter protein|nr:autotransporter outer membrane beta-barrel domain-containing protein [Planctomycetaceae bacterium]